MATMLNSCEDQLADVPGATHYSLFRCPNSLPIYCSTSIVTPIGNLVMLTMVLPRGRRTTTVLKLAVTRHAVFIAIMTQVTLKIAPRQYQVRLPPVTELTPAGYVLSGMVHRILTSISYSVAQQQHFQVVIHMDIIRVTHGAIKDHQGESQHSVLLSGQGV